MAASAQQSTVSARVRSSVGAGTAYVVTPLRTGLVIGVGGGVLLTRAVRWGVERAAEEGERQLRSFNGSLSLGHAASWVWPWRRRASGKAVRAAPRSTR
ncbi:MAG: hypothetical protein HY271_14400 [Deltaproteobacteria bacterium]|nr:hypothetical protein [Deltaproteobacteria bacterium]